MSTPTAMPSAFAAGTTVQYTRSYADYPANDGWALTVYLAGVQVLNVAAAASGADFIVTLSATQTAALTKGLYRWTERVVKSGVKKDAAAGTVEVTPDLATATAGSLQTVEEKALAALDALEAGIITDFAIQYQVGGRSMTQLSPLERWELRRKLQWDVARQRGKGRAGRTRRISFTGTGNES